MVNVFTTKMVPKVRIELTSDPYQGPVLPLNYIGIKKTQTNLGNIHMVEHSGIEPLTSTVQTWRSPS